MKNYTEVLKQFEKILHQNDWPQTLWITPGMYWDLIIAAEGAIVPDWRFHPTNEDEGYPFFLIGPTMVRPGKRANSAHLATFAPETCEEKFVEGVEEVEDAKVREQFLNELDKNESLTDDHKSAIRKNVEEGCGPMFHGGVDDARN